MTVGIVLEPLIVILDSEFAEFPPVAVADAVLAPLGADPDPD